jgi:transposase
VREALSAARSLSSLHGQVLRLFLERLELLERQTTTLQTSTASALREHQAGVFRFAAVPGLGVDSAEQLIAEVGPRAAAFASPAQFASRVGVCPGREESAEVSKNNRTPKGNRVMRRVLNQVANGAVKTNHGVFQGLYRRFLPRLGHNKTI